MLLLLDPVISRDSVMTPVTQVASPFMDYKYVIACAQSLSRKTLESGLGAHACAVSSSRRFWKWGGGPGWLSCPLSRS